MDDHERELRRLRLADRERREDIEASEAELAMATRSLPDALVDLGRVGSVVRLDAVDRSRSGVIVHVGAGVVTVRSDAGIDEVVSLGHVEGVRPVGAVPLGSLPSLSSGEPVRYGHPHSVVAFARSLIGETVRLERRSTPPVAGRIDGVSDDLVLLGGTDGLQRLIPLASVVSICRL